MFQEVFTVSVGNLPPNARVLIKITYVAELLFEGGSVVFKLPNTLAPWDKETALSKSTQVVYNNRRILAFVAA